MDIFAQCKIIADYIHDNPSKSERLQQHIQALVGYVETGNIQVLPPLPCSKTQGQDLPTKKRKSSPTVERSSVQHVFRYKPTDMNIEPIFKLESAESISESKPTKSEPEQTESESEPTFTKGDLSNQEVPPTFIDNLSYAMFGKFRSLLKLNPREGLDKSMIFWAPKLWRRLTFDENLNVRWLSEKSEEIDSQFYNSTIAVGIQQMLLSRSLDLVAARDGTSTDSMSFVRKTWKGLKCTNDRAKQRRMKKNIEQGSFLRKNPSALALFKKWNHKDIPYLNKFLDRCTNHLTLELDEAILERELSFVLLSFDAEKAQSLKQRLQDNRLPTNNQTEKDAVLAIIGTQSSDSADLTSLTKQIVSQIVNSAVRQQNLLSTPARASFHSFLKETADLSRDKQHLQLPPSNTMPDQLCTTGFSDTNSYEPLPNASIVPSDHNLFQSKDANIPQFSLYPTSNDPNLFEAPNTHSGIFSELPPADHAYSGYESNRNNYAPSPNPYQSGLHPPADHAYSGYESNRNNYAPATNLFQTGLLSPINMNPIQQSDLYSTTNTSFTLANTGSDSQANLF